MYMDNLENFKETELPIICSYCRTGLNGLEAEACGQEQCNSSCVSHGICLDCLLENFPQEYIKIQEERRLRIKNTHKNGPPTLIGKLEK